MSVDRATYDELCTYTLTRGDAGFIHQHVVDAHMAQHADGNTKPIGLTFALVGLYLLVEKGWSGRQVQLAHMKLARRRHEWPWFSLPEHRGAMTYIDVMHAPEGRERDEAIRAWCRSVWGAYLDSRPGVEELLRRHSVI